MADTGGNIYFAIGNGDNNMNTTTPSSNPPDDPTDCPTSPCDFGNSVMKLGGPSGGAFPVLDFFTPYDQSSRNTNDYDLGSGGVMSLPYQSTGVRHILAQAGKEGGVYLLQADTGHMGGYNGGNADEVLQFSAYALCYNKAYECGIWGAPSWWNTTSGGSGSTGYAYWGGKSLCIMGFQFTPGTSPAFGSSFSQTGCHIFNYPGTVPAVSSDGANASQAIVWALDTTGFGGGTPAPPVLYAYDAATLDCLYATATDSSCSVVVTTDAPSGQAVKFTIPTVANGRVFVGTADHLNIYGVN